MADCRHGIGYIRECFLLLSNPDFLLLIITLLFCSPSQQTHITTQKPQHNHTFFFHPNNTTTTTTTMQAATDIKDTVLEGSKKIVSGQQKEEHKSVAKDSDEDLTTR